MKMRKLTPENAPPGTLRYIQIEDLTHFIIELSLRLTHSEHLSIRKWVVGCGTPCHWSSNVFFHQKSFPVGVGA